MHQLKSLLKSLVLLEATRFKREMGENAPRWQDRLIRYEEAGGYFVHFSDIPKLGLLIRNKWDTPIGFYAYPLDRKRVSGFASDRKYAVVFKPKPEARILNLRAYADSDLTRDVETLVKMGHSPEKIETASNEAWSKTPGGRIWNVTRVLSGAAEGKAKPPKDIETGLPVRGGGPTGTWTMLLKKLGYDGVNDPGEGIIHPNEPAQAVFFDTTKLELAEVVEKPKTSTRQPGSLFRKDFKGQNLEGKSFDLQDLAGVDFHRAKLNGASFAKATLDGASFSHASLDGTSFSGAGLDEANFHAIKATSANYAHAVISNAQFTNSTFADSNFSNVLALGTEFRHTDLRRSSFAGSDLESAVFTKANLEGAVLKKSRLYNTSFFEANLRGADFENADVEEADFRHADLRGANFLGTYLWQAEVAGALYDKTTKFQRGFDPVKSGMRLAT